jgi:glycosyltransferase involved in cell wall biosynthesis
MAESWPAPRLGVLDFNPIQYHAPLYQRLAERGQVRLDVLYLRDWGYREVHDPGFGRTLSWGDLDLLSGYEHRFLRQAEHAPGVAQRFRGLASWIRSQDVVVIHGYSDRGMQAGLALCRLLRVPYLLRSDTSPDGRSVGLRRLARGVVARTVVSGSAGGLAIGQLNAQFYRKYRARSVTLAPHSVDNDRFAKPPEMSRDQLLTSWGLDQGRPVITFCGKLRPRKRPLDLLMAADGLGQPVSILFVGDGELAGELRAGLPAGRGAVTGFVNQSELPAYYHATDILVLPSEFEPWGLVVNEAMAAGALPVVSDQVGAAPDLVAGLGEVYRCGDVPALTTALIRALDRIQDPALARFIRQRVGRYSLEETAQGFEHAARRAWRAARPGRADASFR